MTEDNWKICSKCQGSGFLATGIFDLSGHHWREKCLACNGKGQLPDDQAICIADRTGQGTT